LSVTKNINRRVKVIVDARLHYYDEPNDYVGFYPMDKEQITLVKSNDFRKLVKLLSDKYEVIDF